MTQRFWIVVLFVFTVCGTSRAQSPAPADELPRRGALGVGFEPAISHGLIVAVTRPGGPAASAGVEVGDRLLAIDREEVLSSSAVLTLLRTRRAGALVTLSVERHGEKRTLAALLDAAASEVVPGSTLTYGSVMTPAGYRVRTIVTFPENASGPANASGKSPLFAFVQGMPCESIDRPTFLDAPDTRLVHAMARAGFATLRVDKPGCGDSEGPPCADLDFDSEVAGHRAALAELGNDSRIDKDRIYIFGHSLGGMIAAELGRDVKLRGAIVYGTVAKSWLEFMLDSIRRQTRLAGASESQVSAAILAQSRLLAPVLIDKRTFGDVIAAHPALATAHAEGDPLRMAGRHVAFYHQLQDRNIASAWDAAATNVLALHGEYDMVVSRDDAETIAAIARAHAGKIGKFVLLPRTDHGLAMHDSLEASRTQPGRFNEGIANSVLAFIAEVEGRKPAATPPLAAGEQPNAATSARGRDALPASTTAWTRFTTEAYPGKQDDVFFVDSQNGFYGNGAGKIFKTTDGGKTWVKKLHQPGTYFRCLAFLDSKNGFAGNIGPGYFPNVTDTVPLYRTQDGGETWAPVTTIAGPPVVGLCALEILKTPFVNAGQLDYRTKIVGVGRVGGPTAFIESRDLGATWQRRTLPDSAAMAFDVHFFDEHHGVIAAASAVEVEKSRARILLTDDEGVTWRDAYTGTRPFELTWKLSFPTREIGYATLQSYDPDPKQSQRYVAKTTDGGKTWTELPLVDDHAVAQFGVAFVDPSHGFIGAMPGGFETTDGGKTWLRVDFGNAVNKIRVLRENGKTLLHAIGLHVSTLALEDPAAAR